MRTRLIACLVGGLLGAAVTSPINDSLGLNPTVAWIACPSIGVVAGYVASIFFHVFAASDDDQTPSPER
jgi:hypothetical protein